MFRSEAGTPPFFGGTVSFSFFGEYAELIRDGRWLRFVYLFFGNIGWFVPLGLYVCLRLKKPLKAALLYGFCLSLFIEAAQYVLSTGVSETDDLILNTAGAAIGWLAGALIRRMADKKQKDTA